MTPTQITECTDEKQLCEWVSVEDKLPETEDLVLVAWLQDGESMLDIDLYHEECWLHWFNRAEHYNIAGGNCNEEAPYTHWMPLPKPPLAALNGEEL